MSGMDPQVPGRAGPWRRTTGMLVAAIAAAALLGVPSDPPSRAAAQTDARPPLKIVHSGPACLAGQAPSQVSPAGGAGN